MVLWLATAAGGLVEYWYTLNTEATYSLDFSASYNALVSFFRMLRLGASLRTLYPGCGLLLYKIVLADGGLGTIY